MNARINDVGSSRKKLPFINVWWKLWKAKNRCQFIHSTCFRILNEAIVLLGKFNCVILTFQF